MVLEGNFIRVGVVMTVMTSGVVGIQLSDDIKAIFF